MSGIGEHPVALVTGAAVRLGRAFALELARLGYDIVVHHFRSDAREVLGEIVALGRRAESIRADLCETDAPRKIAKFTRREFGRLDVLVNSASTYPDRNRLRAARGLREETVAGWEEAMAVNARAPFFLIQELSPLLEAGGKGAIINFLDTSVSHPFLSRAAHTVSKCALAAITDIAARSFFPKIRTNSLELGSLLPPAGLPPEEREKMTWGPVEEALEGLRFILESPTLNGARVGDPLSTAALKR